MKVLKSRLIGLEFEEEESWWIWLRMNDLSRYSNVYTVRDLGHVSNSKKLDSSVDQVIVDEVVARLGMD